MLTADGDDVFQLQAVKEVEAVGVCFSGDDARGRGTRVLPQPAQAGDFRLHQFSGDPSLWREGGEAHDAGGEIAEVAAPRCLRREGEVEVGGARYSACVIIYAPYQ